MPHRVEEIGEHEGEDQEDHGDNAELAKAAEKVNLAKGVEDGDRNRGTLELRNGLPPTSRVRIGDPIDVRERLDDDGKDVEAMIEISTAPFTPRT